ncbi:hypothetical protein BDV28DRAFT_128861 [Aspergillus coremiiformis]|uniref:Uncharacterized protein n=1 Tax=Aspergillus coremiiformis TaxID=138285 RepID=A0A5N6ZCR2_9EURO|nr:hypothetical protein BDV28DRAFT_128861 [Aspergillus coremiiformis]
MMFRSASQPFPFLSTTRRACTARYFHPVTTNFINYDARGNLVTKRVPVTIGNPGEAYMLIEPEVGTALRAASPVASTSLSADDRCKLTFFRDSGHFGFESTNYPRLYVPGYYLYRQTEGNTSPATLFLSGVAHEIVLDGTFDAIFAEHASATWNTLKPVFDQLKDM